MSGTSSLDSLSTKRQRIAETATRLPNKALWSLSHHLDVAWLEEAYRRTRKDGALGVDQQSAEQYAEHLEVNLAMLLDRVKAGSYRAPPVRRAHIPKGNGETRAIGIPTFEDKVLQRAVVMLLEPIYEQEFRNYSYGFRPGRSAHDALASFWEQAMGMAGGWVLEVDIRKYFDTIDHQHLRRIVRRRIADGVLLRLIDKWLNAGVMESGLVHFPDAGTPQGGVISPLLANIYLHEILDEWWAGEVRSRLRGNAFLIRYADDFVMCFSSEDDARRVMDVLPKRFEKYGLALHPTKTRLVPFGSPNRRRDMPSPGSFDFLGFTHFWGSTRNEKWAIKRKTAGDRFRRSLRKVVSWIRANRHEPVEQQYRTLCRKLDGHCAYYGITGNSYSLERFRHAVNMVWAKWIGRRAEGRVRGLRRKRPLRRYHFPTAKAVHSVLAPQAKL